MLCAATTAHATEFHGQVVLNGLPVPGATVTVTRDGKTFSAVTDQQGVYQFSDLADGPWHVTVEMLGFRKLEADATVGSGAVPRTLKLEMLPLDTLLATTHAQTVLPTAPAVAAKVDTATQPAKLKKHEDAQPGESAPAEPAEKSGAAAQDGLLVSGSESNAATSKYSLDPAFGNHRAGSKSLYTGGVAMIADNSVFDARPDSITGLNIPKASYSFLHGTASIGGPLNIPHLMPRGPYFFVNYDWQRQTTATTAIGLVPTVAERGGDLSGVLDASGAPITVINPTTGQTYAGNVPVSPQAAALLALYPLPNVAGGTAYNYETQLLNHTHTDAVQGRLNKSIGTRDEFYGGFALQSSRADAANLFHFLDVTNTLGISSQANWQHRLPHGIFITTQYAFSRLRTEVRPNFDGVANISSSAGITGNSQASEDWGPPALSFSSGIAGLSDANSQFTRNRTDALHVEASQTRGRHSIEVGGEFRRQEFNYFGQQNPRGSFVFTGAATGNDFADFLVGLPDTSTLAFGNADKYLRQSVTNLYVNDTWRVTPELTINAGLRWDYGAPPTELKNRLVNIDEIDNFSQTAPVLASAPIGSLSGTRLPRSLVRGDRVGLEPRVGLAWRPLPADTLVIRAGYGVYDDTSVYIAAMQSMAQQAPLSKSLSVSRSAACPLTLADGFISCAGTTPQVFGIDPNYRVGYAQTWQLSAQRDLPGALVATVTYLGVKGTRGMQQFLPNTYPVGAINPDPAAPSGFVYQTSNGNSTRESAQVQLRRRLRAGFAASVLYTYSKSLDDDAAVGSQGHVVGSQGGTAGPSYPTQIAQNWLDLSAERGLSSFDQRHVYTATLQYTSGMGLGGHTLLSGWRGRLLKEWTASTDISGGTGLPETPIYLEAVAGTGYTGTVRPDPTGLPIYRTASTPAGYFLNTSAYTAPVSGQWGTARRNSITGPQQFSMNAALARTFRLKDPWNFDVRVEAVNVLNHVVYAAYETTVNSTTFGLPASANAMRSLQFTGRLRF